MLTSVRYRWPAFVWLSILAVAPYACGGDADQSAPVPSAMTAVSGDAQTGTVGAALTQSLTVEVRDDAGQPVAGFTVSWSVASGGGSVSAASAQTGTNGQATTTWTLGGSAGAQTVTAAGSGLSVTFTATAEPGPPARVGISGATTLTALEATTQLTGQVQDEFGNALAGDVTWASGDESVATVAADGTVTARANGTAAITATSGSLSGSATVTVAQQAATLAVAPANPVTTVGGTVQMTATGKDANGFDVAGDVEATWSSATTTVATIDAAGLATGVAEGQSVITAASGSATGTATLTVTAAPFEPNVDTTIDGNVSAERISIPAGVTVTLAADATLSSATTLEVAGTLTGDCVAATLAAGGDLTVSGTLNNACTDSTATADLVLNAVGAITLTGATLTTAGSVTIDNTGTASALTPRARSAAGRAVERCDLTGVRIRSQYLGATGTLGDGTATRGATGKPGADHRVTCSGDMTLREALIDGQRGAWGGSRSGSGAEPIVSGDGGRGSDIYLTATGDVRFVRQQGDDPTFLIPGGGGKAGDASATGQTPRAVGGIGGRAGLAFVQAGGSIVVEAQGAVQLTWQDQAFSDVATGGSGGLGSALAEDGADAAGGNPARPGFDAEATGGTGGSVGFPDRTTNLVGDLFMGNVTGAGFITLISTDAGSGGSGQGAGGDGGDGDADNPNGAAGGTTRLTGGEGGPVTLFDNRGNVFAGNAGDGGGISFADGLTLDESGLGGMGWSDCQVGSIKAGGNGGAGSPAIGTPGQGGLRGTTRAGQPGTVNYFRYGNGGNAGDGAPAGSGGAASDNTLAVGAVGRITPRSLQPGTDGSPCAVAIEPGISVTSDPNGHAPFIGLGAVSSLSVQPGADGVLTVTGNGPWVTLTGTVAADGSFELTGTGTVAGFPGVTITFNGKLSLDANMRVTGISEGVLTMDAANDVLPPNGAGQRNPTVYSVTGSASN
ncbi:MAG: Ig-like domain-containing protein [Longimicrobiales bacterium]